MYIPIPQTQISYKTGHTLYHKNICTIIMAVFSQGRRPADQFDAPLLQNCRVLFDPFLLGHDNPPKGCPAYAPAFYKILLYQVPRPLGTNSSHASAMEEAALHLGHVHRLATGIHETGHYSCGK